MKHILLFITVLTASTFLAPWNVSSAQPNNKPFSFNTPSGGPGMSLGGKQTILNKEVFGTTPKNLVRDNDGFLLDVSKEKGGSAIVSYEGGSFIPSFRGSSFKGDNASWSAGVFNTFFVPHNSSYYSLSPVQHTGAVISTWTGRIASDMAISYMPANSLDLWTGMVIQASY